MFENYNPCGPGTVWDASQQRCVPAIPQSQLDPVFNNQLWGNPALGARQAAPANPYPNPQRKYNVFTDPNPLYAQPMQNPPILRDGNGQVSPENRPGRMDARGTWVNQADVNNDALDQGYNYDSDGKYRKEEITEDPNLFWYNDDFQQINFGLDAVRGVANTINTARASRKERQKYLKAMQPDSNINPYESGLNNVPVYMAEGGNFAELKEGGGFGKAFREAKNKGLKTFEWNGKKYTTQLKEDVPAAKPATPAKPDYSNAAFAKEADTRIKYYEKNKPAAPVAKKPVTIEPAPNSKKFADAVRPNIPAINNPMQPQLESGVVVDKRTNQAFVVKAGKIQRSFPVLTGMNPDANSNPYTVEQLDSDPKSRNTPIGGYKMDLYPHKLYGDYGYELNPLKFPGFSVPVASNLAVHNTAHPEVRNKYYAQSGDKRNQSYGCINCKPEDLAKLRQEFPKGDTMVVIDSKKGQTLKSIGIKQEGGPVTQGAELEKGEVFTDINGNINKIPESHPTHEQGGSVQYNVERVLEDTSDKRKDKVSKSLLISPEEAMELVGFKPKGKVSHSKLYEIANDKYTKKTSKIEKQLEENLDFVKYQNGDIHAQASIDENIKFLDKLPKSQQLFDEIYNHQENVKYMNDILAMEEMQYGGKNKKYATGGNTYVPPDLKSWGLWKGDKLSTFKKKFGFSNAADKINDLDALAAKLNYTGPKTNIDFQKWLYTSSPENKALIDKWHTEYGQPIDDMFDGRIGIRWQNAINEMVTKPNTPEVTPNTPILPKPEDPKSEDPKPLDPTLPTFKKPEPVTPSTVNSELGYAAGLGNMLGYIDALERTPVDLEQLQRDPLRVHEVNPLPTLMANQGDFNALVNQLPNSGVGFANQANLSANKYAANNQVLGQYENINKGKYDAVDQYNDQAQFQKDQLNLQLRDQFNNRVLTSKEKQRLQKTEYLNGIFEAIDSRNAFDRNAELMLQMSPYFNERGQFNGNEYQMAQRYVVPGGNTVEITAPDATGQRFRIIRDKDGKLISNSKVIQNKAAATR